MNKYFFLAAMCTIFVHAPAATEHPTPRGCCDQSLQACPGTLCAAACHEHTYNPKEVTRAQYHGALRPYSCMHRVFCSGSCAMYDALATCCESDYDCVTDTASESKNAPQGWGDAQYCIRCFHKMVCDVPCGGACAIAYCALCCPCIALQETIYGGRRTMEIEGGKTALIQPAEQPAEPVQQVMSDSEEEEK